MLAKSACAVTLCVCVQCQFLCRGFEWSSWPCRLQPASHSNCHSRPVCSWGWPPGPARECSSCHCSHRPGKCSQSQSGCHWESSDMSYLGASWLVPFDQIKTPLHVTWTAIFQQVCWSSFLMMGGGVVLCEIVCPVCISWFPKYFELSLFYSVF